MKYVPLHVHSEYSLLDGATRIKELVQHAKENNMPAVAVTDHGAMYASIELYRTAKENGIKPLIGTEMYVVDQDISIKDKTNNANYHLVLIAKSNEGYKNLVKLNSIASVEGFYGKPRIDNKTLEKHKNGLICLSACIGGEIPRKILNNDYEAAKASAQYYKNLFGDDFYIELQDHGIPEQKKSNPELIKLAKELDIELVITNDSHYTRRADASWHEVLLCLQTGKTMNDPTRFKFSNHEFYIKTVDELRQAFEWLDVVIFNKAIDNTVKIAEKCNVILDMGRSLLPNYQVPANHTIESYLDHLTRKGLEERYTEITPELTDRLKFELKIIEEMGFAAYFLIVWDFINFARQNDIPVGPGRGSAAGSLIAYCLGITDIDPIEHNLLFERFLNPERVSMPDVDIDFCIDRREKVIDYVAKKYGEDKVCQIITFGTFAARAALKGVARVLEIPFAEANELAKLIPATPGTKIKDALEDGMDLKKLYDSDEKIKNLVDTALSIEGLKFNVGTHAAGVIISRDPLSDIVPVQPSKDGIIVTQYPMADLEKLGLLKMDFLGLRNLTIIDNTLTLIKKSKDIDIIMNKVPLDDKKVYEMLSNGETDGVFQLESSGMKNLVKSLKPSVFEDLGALVALFRPGPLNSGMVDDFVQRKHGRQKVEYAHPMLETILKDTYGTIVYQEQIMQIAQVLSGYTLGQADILRRAMGKKKAEEMDKQRSTFLEGAENNGVDSKVADNLFSTMTEFAAYCFNRSHSAAYALLAYYTAYLKAHFPIEYMASLLSSVSGDQDKIQIYISECIRLGIEVLPPDVNTSFVDFTPDGQNIRFGLASIKNVGVGVVEDIIRAREEEGAFEDFYDFCTKVNLKSLNKRTLESLIKAGAFSEIEKSRKQLLENVDSAMSSASKAAEDKERGQISLFGMATSDDVGMASFTMTGTDEEFPDSQIQSFEKEMLGFYVTSHPLSSVRKHLPFLTSHNILELSEIKDASFVTICGLISSVRLIPTKTGKYLKAGLIEDLTGSVEFVAFQSTLDKFNTFLEAEQKVIISGKVQFRTDEPSIIVDTVKPVENCNIVNIIFKENMNYETLMALKDTLVKHKGSDPVIFNMKEDNDIVKILPSSSFWISVSNDSINEISSRFSQKIELAINSLDTD